jgi:hypothetical protein
MEERWSVNNIDESVSSVSSLGFWNPIGQKTGRQ